jgi:hypothetical protein
VGTLVWSDFHFSLTASAHAPPAFLAERLRRLDQIWEESQQTAGSHAVPSKHALNILVSIWSIQTSYSYSLFVAETPGDVTEKAVRKTPTPGFEATDGEYPLHDYVLRTERRDYTSMRPIHQICLSQERLVMAKMSYILERLCIPRRLVSIRNDGASIQPGRAWEKAKAALAVTYGELTRLDAFEPLRRAVAPKLERGSTSETRVFRIKETKVVQGVDGDMAVALSPDHPDGSLRVSEDEPFELEDLRWTVVREPETGPDDFYERQVHPHAIEGGRSFICTGAAGTGKSRSLLDLWRGTSRRRARPSRRLP